MEHVIKICKNYGPKLFSHTLRLSRKFECKNVIVLR